MEEFIGTIKLFAFPFAPRGWAQCNGQLLSIAQNSALFALIGTTYGGNGVTNFALPDLRGRMAIHYGQGLSYYNMGQKAGLENVSLLVANLPAHSHQLSAANLPVTGSLNVSATLQASSQAGATAAPANGNVLSAANDGGGTGADIQLYSSNTPNITLGGLNVSVSPNGMSVSTSGVNTGNTGTNSPVSVQNPYLAANYCICLEGVYPSQS